MVNMLSRQETGLLNYSRYRIINVCAEGLNSVTQRIMINVKGFRNFNIYRCKSKVVMSPSGKVEMSPFDFGEGRHGRGNCCDEQEGVNTA